MNSNVEKILQEIGPSLSSVLRNELVKKYNLSETNARQRISRAKGNVNRIVSIKFPRNEKFLYLLSQYSSEDYWENLTKALTSTNSAYGHAFQSILSRGGIVSENEFHIISGAPSKLKNHISSQYVLNGLIRTKLVKIEKQSDISKLIIVDANNYFDAKVDRNAHKARLMVEKILSSAIIDWLKKTGLASYDAIRHKTEQDAPHYGQFKWDITAPSYIYPLVKKQKNKIEPGFIVVDYVVGKKLNESQIKYFIKKCRVLRSIRNIKPFLSILVADSFSNDAFMLGKKEGVIFTTPEILFGRDIAIALQGLLGTLKNAAAVSVKEPEKITTLFNKLSTIEGAATNLRGALFELIVAHLTYKKEGGSVDIGIPVTNYNNGKKAEIDVRRIQGNHAVNVYECKGWSISNLITEKDIKFWIKDRIPLIRKCLLQEERFKNMSLNFEYWTTGIFEDKAKTYLVEAKNRTKKYTINWKDGKDVLNYGRSAKLKAMTDFLKQHFLKHPLSS